MSQRPNYGIDAPGIMIGLLCGGGAVAIGAWLSISLLSGILRMAAIAVALVATVTALLGISMLVYWLIGKRKTREAMLNSVPWNGTEKVLDVGTGAGFLMAGAAKRVPQGHVIGLDSWSAKDLSNNRADVTQRNLNLEGIAGRCSVVTGDARSLEYENESFDRVVSLLCLHNIEPVQDRMRACAEIARVLKPGGWVVLGDYVPTHSYAQALKQAGLRVHFSRAHFRDTWSMMWLMVAQKPTH